MSCNLWSIRCITFSYWKHWFLCTAVGWCTNVNYSLISTNYYRTFISDRNCSYFSSKFFSKNSEHHLPCQGQNTLQLETDERQIISSEYVITKLKSTYMIRHLNLFLGVFLKIKSCCCFDIIGSNLWIQILLYPVIFLNLVLKNHIYPPSKNL